MVSSNVFAMMLLVHAARPNAACDTMIYEYRQRQDTREQIFYTNTDPVVPILLSIFVFLAAPPH